jgi:hypothetical protein
VQSGKPAPSAAYPDRTALDALHAVQAHGASHGFFIAAIFGVVAVVAAIALINVKKDEISELSELVPV